MTVLENVLVGLNSRVRGLRAVLPGARRRDAERTAVREADEILERIGLAAYPRYLRRRARLRPAEDARLARALAARPRLLLLDEPAAGLRNREISFVDGVLVDLARKQGITIVLVEHVMQLVMSVADRVTVLNFGAEDRRGRAGGDQGRPAKWSRPTSARRRRMLEVDGPACRLWRGARAGGRQPERWRKARSPACSAPTAPARPRR